MKRSKRSRANQNSALSCDELKSFDAINVRLLNTQQLNLQEIGDALPLQVNQFEHFQQGTGNRFLYKLRYRKYGITRGIICESNVN